MDSSSNNRRSIDEIINGAGTGARPAITTQYVMSLGYSEEDARRFMDAYEASTPGKKAAMRKRLEGTDSQIAQQASATRKRRG